MTSKHSLVIYMTAITCIICPGHGYSWIEGQAQTPALCPGKYCGRIKLADGNYSSCGACPRGFVVLNPVQSSECIPCQEYPDLYDYLYLMFIFLTTLISHWISIDFAAMRSKITKEILALHISALIETCLAALLSLLIFEPLGSLKIHSCGVKRLSDWYPVLHNPTPNYENKLYCTHEVVYPLFSIVFVFLTLNLVAMLAVRPWLSSKLLPGRGRRAVYAALYFLPVYTLLHTICGGLIYYSYPYIILILSLISSAAHFAHKLDQSINKLFISTVTNVRNMIIMLGHWLLHSFAIVSITQVSDEVHYSLLALVPCPAIFYILTAKFTNPNKINKIYDDQ